MYILQITYIFVFIVMLLMYLDVVFSNTSEISKKLLIFLTSGLVLSLVCILQVFAKTIVEDKFFLNVANATFVVSAYSEIMFACEFNNVKMKKFFTYTLNIITAFFLIMMLTNNAHELVYGYEVAFKGGVNRIIVSGKPLYFVAIGFLYSKIFINFYVLFAHKKGEFTKKDKYFLTRAILCGVVYTVILSDLQALRLKYNVLAIIMVLDSVTLFYISHNFELKLDINKTKLFIVENIDMPIIVIMDGGKIIKHNFKATELFESLNNSKITNVNDLEEIVKEDDVDLLKYKTVKIRLSSNEEKFFNVSVKEIKANFFHTYFLVVLEDATTIKIAEQELEMLTSLDRLTNVNNRDSFTNLAVETVENNLGGNNVVGVFMIDLDYFKSINDTYGHIIGDEFLKATSEILSKLINPLGYVGRYGGEEFCGVLVCESVTELENVLNNLRTKISENYIEVNGGEFKNITVSIGYTISNENNRDMSLLFKQADEALYNAKKSGRNKVLGI